MEPDPIPTPMFLVHLRASPPNSIGTTGKKPSSSLSIWIDVYVFLQTSALAGGSPQLPSLDGLTLFSMTPYMNVLMDNGSHKSLCLKGEGDSATANTGERECQLISQMTGNLPSAQ
eukprot:958463-Ditylum_brightwellii.AAC.1